MAIGEVIQGFRKEHDLSQQAFSQQVPIDRSALARYESGERKPTKQLLKSISTAFDDPRLILAAQEEVSGGASVPWLDNVELHRAVTHLKSMEELQEALEAMKLAPITKRSDQLTAVERELIKQAISECIEAITALTHHVAVLCKEYAFSWLGVWKEHRQKLKANKYMN